MRAGQYLSAIVGLVCLAQDRSRSLHFFRSGGLAPFLAAFRARGQHRLENLVRRRERGHAGALRGTARLRTQPGAWIGSRRGKISRPGAQAESQNGDFRLQHDGGTTRAAPHG